MAWSLVFVLLSVLGLGVAVWLRVRPQQHNTMLDADQEPVIQERIVSRFPSPPEDQALAFVKRALVIRDASEVTAYFQPGSASPEAVIEFLRGMDERDGAVTDMSWLSSMDANGLLVDGVLVNTMSGLAARYRLALLTPDEEGNWRIDFEAFARIVKPSWKELLENQADQGLVRVIVAKDSYFNGPFMDEKQWVCYGMASPDNEEVLLGYCRKDSPQAAAMERIVSGDVDATGRASLKRVTLEIRRSGGGESRQFEITRVLAEDWVLGAKPFDENFK